MIFGWFDNIGTLYAQQLLGYKDIMRFPTNILVDLIPESFLVTKLREINWKKSNELICSSFPLVKSLRDHNFS